MRTNDGGPVYPTKTSSSPDFEGGCSSGVSLRDWFAGNALGFLGDRFFDDEHSLAAYCYKIADAMLKAREQTR